MIINTSISMGLLLYNFIKNELCEKPYVDQYTGEKINPGCFNYYIFYISIGYFMTVGFGNIVIIFAGIYNVFINDGEVNSRYIMFKCLDISVTIFSFISIILYLVYQSSELIKIISLIWIIKSPKDDLRIIEIIIRSMIVFIGGLFGLILAILAFFLCCGDNEFIVEHFDFICEQLRYEKWFMPWRFVMIHNNMNTNRIELLSINTGDRTIKNGKFSNYHINLLSKIMKVDKNEVIPKIENGDYDGSVRDLLISWNYIR